MNASRTLIDAVAQGLFPGRESDAPLPAEPSPPTAMTPGFDGDLRALKETLLTMASHAESAVGRAVRAFSNRDDDLAREVKSDDRLIDELELEVDEAAIEQLGKPRPAEELRFLTVAMKIAGDLERVGDEATTIARRSLELSTEAPLRHGVDVAQMAGIALAMLRDALDAFVDRDPAKARGVVPRDKEVDALNKRLQAELLGFMLENAATITRALNIMVISKSLERIADHATNIAEEVVYLYEAKDIRHTGKGRIAPLAP